MKPSASGAEMSYKAPANYRHGSIPRRGIMLVNLGTPAQPTPRAVRKFLREFLSDPRVVEIPRPLWRLILHLFVLPLRPRKVARAYQKIWTTDGSPLLVESIRQADALRTELNRETGRGDAEILVCAAMCYSEPSIATALESFQRENVRRLLIIPMYPQYSATTTAAVFDQVTRISRAYRWLPELRFVSDYHNHPLYIEACARQILSSRDKHTKRKLIFSFHGLPKINLLKGDPYHCHCHATARLIAERLQFDEKDWMITFQSRFGKAEWLKPYTDETMCMLPEQGVRDVDVFCPGFAADCLETLEEIAIQNKEIFLDAGGRSFNYIPALNSSNAHIEFLVQLVQEHTRGWGDASDEKSRLLARERALALGADD